MGKNNSSKCVVKPVFDELLRTKKLRSFLTMVLPKGVAVGTVNEDGVMYEGHPHERAIPPIPQFLDWCRNHTDELVNPLIAYKRVKGNPKYKFEGYTHPDVYIETSNIRVVIEAKWTEPRITSHTTWRKEGERDQLIRHMDALLPYDENDRKPVYGLFLIDENGKISKNSLNNLFSQKWYFKSSLPHRLEDKTYKTIIDGFCGVYTWQDVKDSLNLSVPNI